MPTPPTPRDVARRIEGFNVNRDPARVAIKYRRMRADPFAFFRGTAHLFWEDWSSSKPRVPAAPLVWAAGDAHLENFGSYRGDNRLVYFDINDFDEAGLAPATADIVRLLASVHVAARTLELRQSDAAMLCARMLDAYRTELAGGKARWVERSTSRGMIRDLLVAVRSRRRQQLLASRTTIKRGRRVLKLDGEHLIDIPADERTMMKEGVQRAGDTLSIHGDSRGFYEVLDLCGRVAGLSSLGLRRYAVLVRGHGGASGSFILDVKEIRVSSMVAHLDNPQPRWQNEADRVVVIQHRMQAISPARLAAVSVGRTKFALRELQPTEDRVALRAWNGKVGRLRRVVRTMGRILAWAQLRSVARGGSSHADALIDFGRDKAWVPPALDYAKRYAATSYDDWREFVGAASP
ncbi:MAG TPA: DUF2252 family protein [Gemmatimonadaceae bacterium]|nr:DUF2252 family protein [Gemmatimonadaceae bacterium]